MDDCHFYYIKKLKKKILAMTFEFLLLIFIIQNVLQGALIGT
jgi:hypothetical protein